MLMVKKIGLQIDKTLGPFTFYIDLQPDKDIKNKTPSSETILLASLSLMTYWVPTSNR
jgi:hypothetical protein